jgi:S1-C subfamily serine protease
MTRFARRTALFALSLGAGAAFLGGALTLRAQQPQQQVPEAILKAEAERVAVIEKVKPAVAAIFGAGGQGGGSGVLITEDGYALTNYHVVAGSGTVMQCGLSDGVLYDAVLVGIDKVGDVALVKLYPKKQGEAHKFPYAVMGDSDLVREGDWSLAMGNPFLLATDFTPTVTYGLVSGVHRYQYPAGVLLEYTDCIQIDTSINPGNSGGPLFNMKGELIGINGRGSFDKRPRINSGVGYAISVNQIKNFMGHLHAGLDVDHASPGFAVTTQTDKQGIGRMEVTQILNTSDAARRGVAYGDELVAFDGRPIFSVNHFKNVLGLFPKGWRVPMEYRPASARGDDDEIGVRKDVLIRLMGVQRSGKVQLEDPKGGPPPKGPPKDKVDSYVNKYYIAKDGFANYYFNKEHVAALVKNLQKQGDFVKLTGKWELDGTIKLLRANTATDFHLEMLDEKAKAGTGTDPVVRFKMASLQLPDELFPLQPGQLHEAYLKPQGSGGFLAAMFLYRELLQKGDKAFGDFVHGGEEPYYPPAIDRKKTLRERKVMGEAVNAKLGAYTVKLMFQQPEDGKGTAGRLAYMEVRTADDEDPCEVYFSNYREVDGRWLPHSLSVINGDVTYGTIELVSIKMN